jgi:hypothetical protein
LRFFVFARAALAKILGPMRPDGRKTLASSLSARLARALDHGLAGAAVVDRKGHVIALAGAIDRDEVMPLTGLVMHRLAGEDLAPRLFGGEVVWLALDERDVAVGVAKRRLFVVAVVHGTTGVLRAVVRGLRDDVENMLGDTTDDPMSWSVPGSSGSDPAALLGITVGRERAKA